MEIKVPMLMGAKTAAVGKICVAVGDRVTAGQVLFNLETQKGNTPVKAPADGELKEVLAREGEQVATGQVMAILTTGFAGTAPATAGGKTNQEKAMREKHAELLIIGGGTGGYVSAIAAAKHGKQVTLVEEDRLGGTCLNRGCIPTKTLITSAELYHRMTEAEEFGLLLDGTCRPQMERIIQRKNAVVDRLVGGVEYLMEKNKIEVLHGTARFVNNKTVYITTPSEAYQCTFTNCIIATGSVQSTPPLPGLSLPGVMDSTAALDSTELPRSVTIIGGGVIGMEFAFLYCNLGVDVTVIVSRDRPLPKIDRDLGETLLDIARTKGIRMETNARVSGFASEVNGQLITTFRRDGREEFAVSERVLLAIGRSPNTERLGLEHTDIALNPDTRGIDVNGYLQTSVPHIYAVGDVNNLFQLAHAASHEGMVAVDHILGGAEEFDRNNVPGVIFTSPEIATVGVGEDEAKRLGLAYKVGKFHFSANGKALTMNEPEGYIKLLKNEQDVIIGGAVIGADASTLIAAIGLAVSGGLTDVDITGTVFAHPTTAEVIHEAALDLSLGAFHE